MIQAYLFGVKVATVMVWGVFGTGAFVATVYTYGSWGKKRRVTSAVYLEVLEDELPTLSEPGLIVLPDNAGIHKARKVIALSDEMGMDVVECSPYAPDRNPDWAYLETTERMGCTNFTPGF
jgi:hypothetical protein